MDTKSKRFDKLTIIRFICIILSLVFTLAGTLKVLKFASFIIENNSEDAFFNVIEETFLGSETDKTAIEKEYQSFISSALSRGLIYTSPDDKGYKLYTDRVRKAYAESLIGTVLSTQTLGSQYFIFYAFDKGYISLELIEKNSTPADSLFCYENGFGYRAWSSANDYYDTENSFILESAYGIEDEDEDSFATTVPSGAQSEAAMEFQGKKYAFLSPKINVGEYFDALCESGVRCETAENKNGARYCEPLWLDEKKTDSVHADAIVDIESSKYYGEYYNGCYSVKINTDKIDINRPDEIFSILYGTFDIDKKAYANRCEEYEQELSSYKNAFYAVLDEESGTFSTNYDFPDGVTSENIAELFGAYGEYYTISSGDDSHSWQNSFQRTVEETFTDFSNYTLGSVCGKFTLWVAYDDTLSQTDAFSVIHNASELLGSEMKNTLCVFAVCTLGFLVCLAILIFLSGRRSYDDKLHMSKFDGIFTDFRTLLDLGLISLGIYALIMLFCEYYYSTPLTSIPIILEVAVGAAGIILPLIFIDLILYVSRHIKNGSLLKNICVVRIISFFVRRYREKKNNASPEYKEYKKKVLPALIGILAVLNTVAFILILVASDYDEIFALLIPVLIAFDILSVWLVMHYTFGIQSIFSAIHKMRMGEYNISVNRAKTPSSLKGYADDLECVGEGLQIAVENATKQQRTKTELITNISHDLKTPLTSIINYVDLLSKRPIDDEEALKYIDVLGEKSEKLKKLIIDLVEASKASTGNVQVDIVKMSLHELISQMVGEYEDDFENIDLSVIVEEKSGDITVSADSKLACRVIDNLMINIKKYAMPGTRVYIKLFKDGTYGCIAISNISRDQLNIPASELKERFVRGDKSRHTEGSGLGLAIAEDFMTLQNGTLDLFINGDMFTALIKFEINE